MPISVYRMMQYSLMEVLQQAHGREQAREYFRQAGYLVGLEFAKSHLDTSVAFNTFLSALQQALRESSIGILRMEALDEKSGAMILTVEEDLECSGLPATGEHVCCFDEGFIAGILKAYTQRDYTVCEIDCWASGSRICRFQATAKQ